MCPACDVAGSCDRYVTLAGDVLTFSFSTLSSFVLTYAHFLVEVFLKDMDLWDLCGQLFLHSNIHSVEQAGELTFDQLCEVLQGNTGRARQIKGALDEHKNMFR